MEIKKIKFWSVVLSGIFTTMKEQNTESVKIKTALVDKLRKYKKLSGIPITVFIEQCVEPEVDACLKNKIVSNKSKHLKKQSQ